MGSKHLFYIFFIVILSIILSGLEALNESEFSFEPSDRNDIQRNINDFGYKLMLKMMNSKKEKNAVLSPIGVAGVLAMALLGSVGRTHGEIALALGFPQHTLVNRENHEQLGQLIHSLSSNATSSTVYANILFVDVHTQVRQLYRDYLYNVYKSDVMSLDFGNSEDAKTNINSWVKNHTEGIIDNFLKKPLPQLTKVVLLSALYFSDQWEKPFVPEYTRKMIFKRTNDEVLTDLMLNFGRFRYIYDAVHDLQMVALPYNNSETVLYALKPRIPKQTSLLELMEKMNMENIENIINQMTYRECIIRFPKMELNGANNLENALKSLGIRSMFTPGEANFALLVNDANTNEKNDDAANAIKDATTQKTTLDSFTNPGIHVDIFLHDVKISVNEYGTTAVAATGAILGRTAEQFYADSPFFMFIRNERTKLVTFSAAILDPTV